jgi:hypothetical protein
VTVQVSGSSKMLISSSSVRAFGRCIAIFCRR